MDTIVILLIASTLMGLMMTFQAKKLELEKESLTQRELSMIYISSVMFGSIGVLCGVVSLDFQRSNKKFVVTNSLILLIQLLFIVWFVLGG